MSRAPRQSPRRTVHIDAARLGQRREARPGRWSNPYLRLGALVLGLAAVAALLVDLIHRFPMRSRHPVDDPTALVLGINDRHYEDPKGRYRVTVPASWLVRTGAEAAPYTTVFLGPRDVEIYVDVNPSGHDSFRRLLREIYRIERDWGVNMNIQTNTFRGMPCVERTVRLVEQEVWAVDFLRGDLAYHLQFGAPRADFMRYTNLFASILATVEPTAPVPAPPGGAGEPGS